MAISSFRLKIIAFTLITFKIYLEVVNTNILPLKQKMTTEIENQVHQVKIQGLVHKVKVLEYNLISIKETRRK